MIVIDSCAAIEVVRKSPEGMALRCLMQKNEEVATCDLFRAEAASVYRKFVRMQVLTLPQAEQHYRECIALVDAFYSMESLQIEVLRESVRLDHSAYDLFYFVLARRTGATLFTLDAKLMRLCEAHGVQCVSEVQLG